MSNDNNEVENLTINEEDLLNFPIFAVRGDKDLDEEVKTAAGLNMNIVEVSENLIKLTEDVKDIGLKLNLYVNNIINRKDKFDHEKHILIFNDLDELCIYPQEQINEYIKKLNEELNEEINEEINDNFENELISVEIDDNEILDDILENLPPTDDKYILNKKQFNRCSQLIDDYNGILIEYEYNLYELNECTEEYEILITNVKNSLINATFLDVVDKTNHGLEIFDNDKHELIITKDIKNLKWKFIYIRKEDVERFFKSINKEKVTFN